MTQELVATIALPRWSVDGRPSFGPDEDPFTFLATAIERSFPDSAHPRLVSEIHAVGELSGVPDGALRALVDGPPQVTRWDSLSAAEARVSEDFRRGGLLVGVVESERGPHAYAIRVTGPGGPSALGPDRKGHWIRVPLHTPMANWGERISAAAGSAAQDLSWLPLDAVAARRLKSLSLSVVSEGAYIPHPRYLENLASRWRWLGEKCATCGRTNFPIRGRCRSCGGTGPFETTALPLDGGTILASTEIGKGGQPTEFDPFVEAVGPYGVAVIEPVPGLRATLATTDGPRARFAIGATVGTSLRRLYPLEGEWRYGRKATPAPD